MSGFIAPALSFQKLPAGLCPGSIYRKGLFKRMKLIARRHIWKFVGLLVIDGLAFTLTNAKSVPSFGLIVGFVLLIATLYYLAYSLLTFARLYGLSIGRKRRLAGSLAGLVSGLVALQSIGELNSRDVLVLLPLVVIGYAYSFYGKTGTRTPAA
jgi:hypothetical protein